MTPKELTPEQIQAVKVWASLNTLERLATVEAGFAEWATASNLGKEVVKLSGTCSELSANLTEARDELRNLRTALNSLIHGHAEYLELSTKARVALTEVACHGHKTPRA